MKKIIKNIFIFLLAGVSFVSCKKDEDRINATGGTRPVLTPSSTADIVMSKPNAAQLAVSFSWTNPEYQFTTGISSQDVTYSLQIDVEGANFSTPGNLADIVITKNLSIDLTDSVLNYAIAHIGENGLEVDVPHNLEFRIKAALRNNSLPLYSDVVKITVTPYLDVAAPVPPTGELYLTGSGSASGWINVNFPTDQKFTQVSPIEYTLTVPLSPGLQLKFLSTPGFWQPQYGLKPGTPGSDTGGALGFNMGLPGQSDPTEIPTPSLAGTYKITVQFGPGKYKFEKQ